MAEGEKGEKEEAPAVAHDHRFIRCHVRFADDLPTGHRIEWVDCVVEFAPPLRTIGNRADGQ